MAGGCGSRCGGSVKWVYCCSTAAAHAAQEQRPPCHLLCLGTVRRKESKGGGGAHNSVMNWSRVFLGFGRGWGCVVCWVMRLGVQLGPSPTHPAIQHMLPPHKSDTQHRWALTNSHTHTKRAQTHTRSGVHTWYQIHIHPRRALKHAPTIKRAPRRRRKAEFWMMLREIARAAVLLQAACSAAMQHAASADAKSAARPPATARGRETARAVYSTRSA